MKYLILFLVSFNIFAEFKTNEMITNFRDVYRTKPDPVFNNYIITYYGSTLNKEAKKNPDLISYKTVPVFFNHELEKSVDLEKNSLPYICYFFKEEKVNIFAVNVNVWNNLPEKERDELFFINYHKCRFKNQRKL